MMARVSQAHIDQRREDIVVAARDLFSERGWQDTSIQEIASEAGISTGLVYRYFENKDALLRAVFERAQGLLAERIEQSANEPTYLATMKAVGLSVLNDPECADPRMQLEVSLAGARDPETWGPRQRELTLNMLAMIETLVAQAKGRGEIGKHLDTKLVAQLLYIMVPGISALRMQLGEEPDIEGLLDTVVTLLASSAGGDAPSQ